MQNTKKTQKNTRNRIANFIWNNMELRRILQALTALFRSIIRIGTFPIVWVDYIVEYIRGKAVQNYRELKQPTDKQIRQKTIAVLIDGIVSNKNSALANRAINRLKIFSIILLECASIITTTIGMMIVAADISPIIVIIWAVVIQGFAGVLSGTRGKWNNIILAVCLFFSIASDYVCYINAVFPYNQYIERSYTEFKSSYDPAWERALELVQGYESSDEMIDTSFDNVEQGLSLLKATYNETNLEIEKNKLQKLENELAEIDPITKYQSGTDVVYDSEGNAHHTRRYDSTENPEYNTKINEIDKVTETISIYTDYINTINEVEFNMASLKGSCSTVRAEAKRLFALSDEQGKNEYAIFSGKFLKIQKDVNSLLESNGKPTFDVINLSDMKRYNVKYDTIKDLALPEFAQIEDAVKLENDTIFDKLFEGFTTVIDSEFAVNSVDLKKKAELETKQKYEKLMAAIAGMASSDAQLQSLVYKNENPPADSSSAVSLEEAYEKVKYQDALSRAFTYLLNPGENVIETYSRVLYACLADGLVLLIGFSLRRRRTSIYRIHNHRDLVNEEPRLISEAFYNLSARPVDDNPETAYQVNTLIAHLNDFISCFEPEPLMRDPNLKMNFGLVCKKPDEIKRLNSEFKELICLLQTLKYIKPISVEQYNFFTQYKLNKASLDSQSMSQALDNLEGQCEEYYYLMTEGFVLYFSEKINDLYQHKESETWKKEFEELISGKQK